MEKTRMLQFGQLPTEIGFALVEDYNLCAEITIMLWVSPRSWFFKWTGNIHSKCFWQFPICVMLCNVSKKMFQKKNLCPPQQQSSHLWQLPSPGLYSMLTGLWSIFPWEKEPLYKLFTCFSIFPTWRSRKLEFQQLS